MENILRVLTHPLHTGYDFELAKTGYEFYSMRGHWDYSQRPQPPNWHVIGDPEGPYDVAIAGGKEAFSVMKALPIPIIWIVHEDLTHGRFDPEIERRCSAVVFSSREVAGRNDLHDPSKKRIIEHSVDGMVYRGWEDGPGNVLAVANRMKDRPEKGLDRLIPIARQVPVDLLGADNTGLPFSIGAAQGYDDLLSRYRRYKAFVNPSDVLSTSVLEAMATGLPTVTWKTINFTDLFVDGQNGFVVHSCAEAVDRLKTLLKDAELRRRIGRAGRADVIRRFGPRRFQARWRRTLREAVGLPADLEFPSRTVYGVVTCRRPGDYVHMLVASLKASGFFSSAFHLPLLLAIGGMDASHVEAYRTRPDAFEVDSLSTDEASTYPPFERMTPATRRTLGHWRCIRKLLTRRDFDFAAVFEDDVVLARGWGARLTTTLRDIVSTRGQRWVLALYLPHAEVSAWYAEGALWFETEKARFFGGQAVVYPKGILEEYAERLKGTIISGSNVPSDMILKEFCIEKNIPILASAPCMAQHIGEISVGTNPEAVYFHQAGLFLETLEEAP
jgi:glycosyltransferase involved in cell wall biosynthesis